MPIYQPESGAKLRPPRSLVEVSWNSAWQTDEFLTMPLGPGKALGITSRVGGNPEARLLSKATHFQDVALGYAEGNPAYTHLWRNLRGPSVGFADRYAVRSAFPKNLNFIAMAQMMEDGMSVSEAEASFQECYQKLVNEFGITSPAQCGIHGDYFDGFRENTSVSIHVPRSPLDANRSSTYTKLRDSVSTQAKARLIWDAQNNDYKLNSGNTITSDYFTQGYYNFRNWYVRGYLDNLRNTFDGARSYELIGNLNRYAMAAPDRHVLTYGWSSLEGTESLINRTGVFPQLHFDSPNGEILRNGLVTAPHNLTLEDCFFTLLLGSRYVLWDVFSEYDNDIAKWFISRHGDEAWMRSIWKTRWRTAGNTYDYDSAPAPKPSLIDAPGGQFDNEGRRTFDAGRAIFPEVPRTADQGAACGAWLYSQIRDCMDVTVEWPQFTFLSGGLMRGGYYNGQYPQSGSLGNAQCSRFGIANYGENNIFRQHENALPIVIFCVGTGGVAIIIKNSFADVAEESRFTIFDQANGRTLDCLGVIGSGIHVYRFPRYPPNGTEI